MKTIFAVCVVFTSLFFSFENRISAKKGDKLIRSSAPIADRYIVVLEEEFDGSALASVEVSARDLSAGYGGRVEKVYSSSVKGYSVEMSSGEAERLSRDPRVKYVEEDSQVWEQQVVISSPGWGLDRIDQRSLPYDLQYTYDSAGSGVNVYVLDSGVMVTHEALLGRAFNAYNASHDNTPIENCNGHGTGVAGVVASSNYGTARLATIQSVRVLPCAGYGTLSDLIAGVDWVTRNANRPAVANMSVSTNYSRTLNSSVAALVRSGVSVVVAAGNNGGNACDYSPSSTPEAITVGATGSSDQRLSYSNIGSCVSLFAPGEGVATIWNVPGTTTYQSGTSFASPFVAGVAAQYLSDHPTATPDQVKSAIVNNATLSIVGDPGAGTPNLFLYSRLPSAPSGGCGGVTYLGSVSGPGSSSYQSGLSGFAAGTGDFSGRLTGESGAQLALTLEKKSKSRWTPVATTSGAPINYRGRSGTYRWRVDAVAGSGNYSLCSATP